MLPSTSAETSRAITSVGFVDQKKKTINYNDFNKLKNIINDNFYKLDTDLTTKYGFEILTDKAIDINDTNNILLVYLYYNIIFELTIIYTETFFNIHKKCNFQDIMKELKGPITYKQCFEKIEEYYKNIKSKTTPLFDNCFKKIYNSLKNLYCYISYIIEKITPLDKFIKDILENNIIILNDIFNIFVEFNTSAINELNSKKTTHYSNFDKLKQNLKIYYNEYNNTILKNSNQTKKILNIDQVNIGNKGNKKNKSNISSSDEDISDYDILDLINNLIINKYDFNELITDTDEKKKKLQITYISKPNLEIIHSYIKNKTGVALTEEIKTALDFIKDKLKIKINSLTNDEKQNLKIELSKSLSFFELSIPKMEKLFDLDNLHTILKDSSRLTENNKKTLKEKMNKYKYMLSIKKCSNPKIIK